MHHDNKQLTRRWFDEVWNQRRVATIHEMIRPGTFAFGLTESGGKMRAEEFLPFWERFTGAFPDLRIEVDDVIGEGEQTVCRLTCTGTHSGSQLGVPPTGRRVRFGAMVWSVWSDGMFAQSWNEFDAWGLMQQVAAGAPQARVKQ
jgi:predicted ester cyclase